MADVEVAVVGGGLAGLVTARRLAANGKDVVVVEKNASVGGRVRTRREDGYCLDRGFQVLFTAYPGVRDELDVEALELRTFRPGAVLAREGHRSVLSDPLRDPGGLFETLANRNLTLSDKLNTVRLRQRLKNIEPSTAFSGPDTSIKRYLQAKGFSDQYIDRFFAPFYGGITLDRSLATSKHVFEYTFGILAAGAIGFPAAGMAAIPMQLAEKIRAETGSIRTNQEVTRVTRDNGGVLVETRSESITADAAVIAAGPKGAEELTDIDGIPLEMKGCVTQYYTLPGRRRLDLGRRLILNAGGPGPNHVVPHSDIAPEHAPENTPLLSATFLGHQNTSATDLVDKTRSALADWFPERDFTQMEVVDTVRVANAQFSQPPGFRESLPGVSEPAGPVYLAGDFTEWSSIQGAIASGQSAAKAVNNNL